MKILKMPNAFHIILDENRHSVQQPQRNAPTQRRRLRKIDKIFQTKAQAHALRKLYIDTVGGVLCIVVVFKRDLTISNVALAGEFDGALCHFDGHAFGKSDEVTADSLEFGGREGHCCVVVRLPRQQQQ